MKNLNRSMIIMTSISLIAACTSSPKDNFIQGCMASAGEDRSTCSCAYDEMKKDYPPSVMDHIGEPTWQKPDDFGHVTVKAIIACRPDYQAALNQAH